MPTLSKKSLAHLATCHPDLQTVCNELIKQFDFSVLEGFRAQDAQNAAYHAGTSRARWPNSAHNKIPSLAVDLAPYPVDWKNVERFREMIIRFDALAHVLRTMGKIKSNFVYGGYWADLKDWPHIEIKEK